MAGPRKLPALHAYRNCPECNDYRKNVTAALMVANNISSANATELTNMANQLFVNKFNEFIDHHNSHPTHAYP